MSHWLVAHGALGSAAQMQPIVEALRALDGGLSSSALEVTTVEFPGHGHTALAHADDFRIAHYVDVMAQVVAQLSARLHAPPRLFGYSMGGYVGLALEARRPGSFSGIVTLGTKFEWDVDAAEREAARLDPVVIATKIPRFAAALDARHRVPDGWEGVVLRTATLLRENARAPMLTAEVLERVRVPVIAAVGAKDETVSRDETQRAADLMLHAECRESMDVPHPIERVPLNLVGELAEALGSKISAA